ncbi:MAG: DUF2249 domain-containing protein [Saprospiraceae bacterium]|nr:MAG: hypothetical protein UZ09_BCD002000868 [Bacteroidetes bacterium OLB9]MCO6463384.1 DUF2249 domain-containing protein [Saprospiraceae bacterium]MCZ2338464.1 DUF2249 domain-containing protein [Chitinophagales bacterium]
MLINQQTKIAALLKHHPDALETIVTLSPDFKKLRNPILRRLMAGRTSIAMAAKIGGVKPEDFFNALAPLGFEYDRSTSIAGSETQENMPEPAFLKSLQPNQIVEFDVRGILAAGEDPLKAIQQKVKALQQDQALLIINTFEPVPLIKLLEKQGFETYVKFVDDETIETYFFKSDENKSRTTTTDIQINADTSDDWDEILKKYEGHLQEVDVRHLEMPMPMMTILGELENLPDDAALYVYHKRVPVFLLNELRDRAFDYRIKDVQEGEVYLLIFRSK